MPGFVFQPAGQLFSDENRAVPSSGAAQRNCQVAFAFGRVTADQGFQEPGQVFEEGLESCIG